MDKQHIVVDKELVDHKSEVIVNAQKIDGWLCGR